MVEISWKTYIIPFLAGIIYFILETPFVTAYLTAAIPDYYYRLTAKVAILIVSLFLISMIIDTVPPFTCLSCTTPVSPVPLI